jgi:hypothetical protein
MSRNSETSWAAVRTGVLSIATAALGACSMAGSIQRDALEYNASVANYNDQMLLYTVLRSRDEAPINLLALSTINGSVSLQEGIGGTTTRQHFGGAPSSPELAFSQTLTPSIAATSSPTWSMASLDTQGFMLGIIQPISPMYVVSKWSTGLDREFLLRVFIKAIQIKDERGYHEYLNDPSPPESMTEFSRELHSWFPRVNMRSLAVLEPLGPSLDPSSVTSISTTWNDVNKPTAATRVETTGHANPSSAALLGAYQYLMPLGSGPYLVGNAPPASAGGDPRLQLYREYPQQVVLCVPRSTLQAQTMSSGAAPLGPIAEMEAEEQGAMSAYALALKSAAKSGAGRPADAVVPAAAGSSVPGLTPGSAKPAPTGTALSSNLKVDRVAALLPLGACVQDELVLPPYTEEENARNAGTYSHVEWRSISEVIGYLGALLRPANRDAGHWTSTDGAGHTTVHTLFALSADGQTGFTEVRYRGAAYSVTADTDEPRAGSRDHSMEALSLLNELIGIVKISSDIPNTQAIQIVP